MSEKIPSLAPTSTNNHTSVPFTPRQLSVQVSEFYSPKAFQSGEEAYAHHYLTLKSQRTILQGLLKKISDDRPQTSASLTPPHQPQILYHDKDQIAIKIFRDFLNSFLNCSYGELLIVSAAATDALQPIIRNQNISDSVKKIAHRLMNSVLAINHLLTSIQNEFRQNPTIKIDLHNPFSNHKDNNNNNHNSDQKTYKNENVRDDTDDSSPKEEICRICNESVPIELFEEHIQYCQQASQAEGEIGPIQTEMTYIQNTICEDYLGVSWPGEKEDAEKTILPILRASLLLERAYQIDSTADDAIDELKYICEVLSFLVVEFIVSPFSKTICNAKDLILKKTHLATILSQAAEVLKKTRISGNADTQKLTQIQICDFSFIKRISAGAFARVFLAKKKVSNDIYAIKVLSKDDVVQKNQVRRVVLEKDILLRFNNPYIINFYYSISGARNLYLVMEYLPGGDLYSLLQELGCLNEETAKTYTYQIAVALSYLHSKGIIHRDIKPDNVLIAADGTIKLTDFGLSYVGITDRNKKAALNNSKESHIRHSLSTENHLSTKTGHSYRNTISQVYFDHFVRKNRSTNNNDDDYDDPDERRGGRIELVSAKDEKLSQTRSIVGTPDYIAPEIIEGKEHTFAVDWWSLGAVLYEFLVGQPPFHAEPKEKIYQNIKACNYRLPTIKKASEITDDDFAISEEAADLIKGLLTLDPSKRLGTNSCDEVLNHKWFSDIDPSNIMIPFKPELSSEIDTTYFKQRYTFTNTNDTDIKADIEDAQHPSSPFGNYRFRKRSSTQGEIHEQSLLVPQENSNLPPSPRSLGKVLQRNENVSINNISEEINLRHIINSCSYDNIPKFFQSDDSQEPSNPNNENSITSSTTSNEIPNSTTNNINLNSSNSINSNYDASNSNLISSNNSNNSNQANSNTDINIKIDSNNSTSASNTNTSNTTNTSSSSLIISKRTASSPYPENDLDDSLKNINEIAKHIKGPKLGQYPHSISQIPLTAFKSSPSERNHNWYRRLLSDNDKEKDQQNSLSGNAGSDKSSISNSSTPSILSAGPSDTNLHLGPLSNSDYVDNDSEISSFPTVSLNDPANYNEWTNDFISYNIDALQKKNKEVVNSRRSSRLLKDENGNHIASNSFTTIETKNKEINHPKKRPSFSSIRMLSADDMYLPKFSGRNKSSHSRSNENSVDNVAIHTNTDSMETNQDGIGNQNENQKDDQDQS